jgi:peptidyl-prolyl cis-trans isomerase B (cyclophilin B)
LRISVFLILSCCLFLLPACSSQPNPVVEVETTMGSFKVELYARKAPITVKNFLAYVDEKLYDGTVFHRVIGDFMIQGGGFEAGKLSEEKPTRAPIKNEASNGLSNKRGTIAMARTDDPDSATSQFFINVEDNTPSTKRNLDRKGNLPGQEGYAVFGKVIEGMDVVDKIREVPTEVRVIEIQGRKVPMEDVPVKDVVIKSIRRVGEKK